MQVNSLACYMFRPLIMAIIREVCFAGYITLERQTIMDQCMVLNPLKIKLLS
jgi:hypothetical protein